MSSISNLSYDEEQQLEKAKHDNRLREIEAERQVMREEKRLQRSNIKLEKDIR